MPQIDMIATGKNIKNACKNAGMTIQQMADTIGVTTMACSKWCRGICMPTIDNMVIICHMFNIKLDDLIVSKIV